MCNAIRLKLFLIILLFANLSFVFAQDNAFKKKQDSLKLQNNLIDWIYERLDYASNNPIERNVLLTSIPKIVWRTPNIDNEKFAWLDYLNTLGYYQLQDGKILDAINSYENAFSYFEKNKLSLKDYDIVEYTLKPLSNNYTRLGDYERALFLQKKSIEIIQNKGQTNLLPSNYGNMAISFRSMGNLVEAVKSIQQGRKFAKPNNEINILLNNIYADILFDQNKLKEAKLLIEHNIAKLNNTNIANAAKLISAYTTAGNINLKLNNLALAENYFNKALNTLNKNFDGVRIREKANLFTQLGKTKIAQNNPLLAINYFNQTLKTLQITDNSKKVNESKIYGENKLMEVFEQMASAYLAVQKPNDAFKNIQLALFTADKIRSEFADDKTKERLQADTKNIAERGIEICYNQYLKTKNKQYLSHILNLTEQSKSRTLLDQIMRNQQLVSVDKKDTLFIKKRTLENAIIFNEQQEIESKKQNKNSDALKFELALINKQIKEKYKQSTSAFYNFSIEAVLSKLPNNQIITYFFGNDAIYVLSIKNKTINQIEKINQAKKVKLAIQNFSNTYFQQGPNAMINAPRTFVSASNHIYQIILPNITLAKNEKITIIPDGIIGYISFDGLITNPNYIPNISKWPFLIKNNIITYAFSLNTLTNNKTHVNDKNFTGLFITHQKGNNNPLLAVKQEAESISKIIKGKFLFNDQVNKTSFNHAFDDSNILHIGTHAYLSGKNAEPTLDLGKEKIYLFELATKKTTPALVVLSACRTADGILANGEGIISLSRGFTAIGTPATIAGLWNVNDDAASVITANFYKQLLAQKNCGEALHLSKLNWLSSVQNTDAMYLPYYWDSLIYMGADQNINLVETTNWNNILITISAFILLILISLTISKYRKAKTSLK